MGARRERDVVDQGERFERPDEKRKVTPMPVVVMARQSWRTHSDAMPTTNPAAPATAAAGSSASASGTPALVSNAAV